MGMPRTERPSLTSNFTRKNRRFGKLEELFAVEQPENAANLGMLSAVIA